MKMDRLDWQRKLLSLWLTVLVGVLVVYITFAGAKMQFFSQKLAEMESYGQMQSEEFLDQAIYQNTDYLDHIEARWESHYLPHLQRMPGDNHVKWFLDLAVFDLVPSWVELDMFIVADNGSYEAVYALDEYRRVDADEIIEKVELGKDVYPICGDDNTPFGEGDRMYWTGRHLEGEGISIKVYLGFQEQLLYGFYKNALDNVAIEKIRQDLSSLFFMTLALLIIVILMGVFLIHGIRNLEFSVYKAVVDEYVRLDDIQFQKEDFKCV